MTDAEAAAVDELLADSGGRPASITRTDPGERGPLRVQIGDLAWLVDAAGTATAEQ